MGLPEPRLAQNRGRDRLRPIEATVQTKKLWLPERVDAPGDPAEDGLCLTTRFLHDHDAAAATPGIAMLHDEGLQARGDDLNANAPELMAPLDRIRTFDSNFRRL